MTGKDKGNLDRLFEGNEEQKKKVRRRVKKQPDGKSKSKSRTLTVDDIGPSKFRQKSADWMSDMEESVHREHSERNEGFNLRKWMKSMTAVQWAAGFMAIVLVITSVTGTVAYANYQGEQKLTEAFATLESYGEMATVSPLTTSELETVDVPLAMEEAPEKDEAAVKTLSLVLTSVEKDLKIKVVDGEDTLVKGVTWKVNVTNEKGKATEFVDDDQDGVIHATDMAAGEYSVALVPDDSMADYTFPSEPMTVAVKAKVEYKVIQDIKDEIKKESEINVAAEDTGGKQAADVEQAPKLTDTVEFVESTKTPKGSSKDGYEEAKVAYIGSKAVTKGLINLFMATMESLQIKSRATFTKTNFLSLPIGFLVAEETSVTPSTEPTKPTEPEPQTLETIAVSGISLSKSSMELTKGGTDSLTATVTPDNATDKNVSWSSSDSNIASVNNGTVTAINAGDATITASCGGQSASCSVKVTKPASTYTFSITAPSGLKAGGAEGTMSYSGSGSNGETITGVSYSSSNSACASMNGDKIKPVSAGKVTITGQATFSDGNTKPSSVEVTIAAADVKKSLQISGTSSIKVGDSTTLKATVVPTTDTVTWASSNQSIATVVSNTGVVTGKAVGTARITATSSSKETAYIDITVTASAVKITKIEMPQTMSLGLDEKGTLTATVTYSDNTTKKNTDITWKSSNDAIATVSGGTVTAKGIGEATITATCNGDNTKSCTTKVTVTNKYSDNDQLYDSAKNPLYLLENGKYRLALYKDYKANKSIKLYKQAKVDEYLYTGWQTIDGLTYYFKKDNTKVTGEQIIGGVKYNFAADGALSQGNGTLGIDVSKYQPNINWSSVKASGISYVIIRCGYRGASTGALIEDPYFRSHIKGAKSAGLKVGVYFFTTAVTEAEAVEEASMCAALCSGYGLNYPVFMDCESSGRPGYMSLSAAQRTSIIKAFCSTVRSAGYTPGVYANKTWLTSYINTSEISNYKIWLAQYNSTVTYKGRYDLWQFTSKGSVNGIPGVVDMNQSYLGY